MITEPNAPFIISHHFNNAQGIQLRQVDGGGWEFKTWPEELGPIPQEGDVASWKVAYELSNLAEVQRLEQLRTIPEIAATSVPELVLQVEAMRLALVEAGIIDP